MPPKSFDPKPTDPPGPLEKVPKWLGYEYLNDRRGFDDHACPDPDAHGEPYT